MKQNNMDESDFKEPVLVGDRKIRFEVYDEKPKEGDYCVFGNKTAEETDMNDIDFIFVDKIIEKDGYKFVVSPDIYTSVRLDYCWKIKMSVFD